jgi:hypothetical protein
MNTKEAQNAQGSKHPNPAQFRAMKEDKLRQYEAEHREAIATASIELKMDFNKTWERVIGQPYFQPVTTKVDSTERIDPKSQNYDGYWEVLFSPKAKPDDPTDVKLSWNGQCLQMKRGEAVVVPGPFLEVADNAVYPTYRQMPGEDRKITSYVKHFPYTVLRRATEKEYRERKAAGDKATKEARAAAERV